MSYKMLWETMKEALECRVDEEAEDEYKYIRLSTLPEGRSGTTEKSVTTFPSPSWE